ncbi:MAG TPA: response regulator [Terriglobales bacterium]|nr:response regulator [Terriglobales bacterium]
MPKLNFETVPLTELRARKLEGDRPRVPTYLNAKDGRTKVLVVDDERVIADTLGKILQNSGYEASVSYDATSALQQCANFHPALVITDVIMPGMNGVEMAMLIREREPRCKILLISGQASTTNLLEGARQRGYEFELLAKPIHPTDLLSRLAALVSDAADDTRARL